jgi:VanZ family protein
MRNRLRGVLSRHSRALGIVFANYWCVMFVATHLELPQVQSAPQNTDKLVHLVMYAGFTFLFSLWLSTKKTYMGRTMFFIWGVSVGYAGLDELLQTLTPTRSAEVLDFAMDLLGALLGLGMFWMFHRKFPSLWVGEEDRVHGDGPNAGLY